MNKDNNCWLVRGSCVSHGFSGLCPRRRKLLRARAWKSIYGRLRGVPEVTMVTLTTGKPGLELVERFNALRLGARALAQEYKWHGISAVEWVWSKNPQEYGWHVHAHVVIVGRQVFDLPRLRRSAVNAGLGKVVHVRLADYGSPQTARDGALYAVKYVAKGIASPERAKLKGRRLWTGHGSLSSWKGSPGWKENIRDETARLQGFDSHDACDNGYVLAAGELRRVRAAAAGVRGHLPEPLRERRAST